MILLRVQLAPRERHELFREIDVVRIVAIVRHVERRERLPVAAQERCIIFFEPHEIDGPLALFEEREYFFRRLRPFRRVAERLQRGELAVVFVDHIEHVVLHGPLDVIRRVPHEEVREIQMAVFIISGMEKAVEDGLVFLAERFEVDDKGR